MEKTRINKKNHGEEAGSFGKSSVDGKRKKAIRNLKKGRGYESIGKY